MGIMDKAKECLAVEPEDREPGKKVSAKELANRVAFLLFLVYASGQRVPRSALENVWGYEGLNAVLAEAQRRDLPITVTYNEIGPPTERTPAWHAERAALLWLHE